MTAESQPHWYALALTAASADITVEETRECLASRQRDVIGALLANVSAPRFALEEIYRRYPEYALDVCLNPEAPARYKLSLPVWMHAQSSLVRLLEELDCSPSVSVRFWELVADERQSSVRDLLREAWGDAEVDARFDL